MRFFFVGGNGSYGNRIWWEGGSGKTPEVRDILDAASPWQSPDKRMQDRRGIGFDSFFQSHELYVGQEGNRGISEKMQALGFQEVTDSEEINRIFSEHPYAF